MLRTLPREAKATQVVPVTLLVPGAAAIHNDHEISQFGHTIFTALVLASSDVRDTEGAKAIQQHLLNYTYIYFYDDGAKGWFLSRLILLPR